MISRLAAASFCGAFATSQSLASAQAPPPPAERLHVYSPYEQETIDHALESLHAVLDPDPEGKLVERVDVVPLDVIEKRDPLPLWVNLIHVTTRPWIVRREMLLREGDRYQQVLVDDTIRNLRRLPQLSVVLAVATAGSSPDRVVVVVITKDVWSLRLNWNLVAPNGRIELFEVYPAETNVAGTHQTERAHFALEPSAYTFGLGYSIPRLVDSRIAMVTSADVMVNRQTGAAEGTYGSLVAGQPLFSGRTEWAWDGTVAWQDVVNRRYVDALPSRYRDPGGLPCALSPPFNCIPFEFRQRQYTTSFELTRSFGWDVNHDISLAAGIDRRSYSTDFPGADPQTVAHFVAKYVPVSDTRVGPSLQYHTYVMRFVRVIDFDTLGLQEDYRIGHDIVLRVHPSLRSLGASRDVLGLYGAAQYTVAVRDGLMRFLIRSTTEREYAPDDRISDASVEPAVHLVSPTIAGLGRVVMDVAFLYRWRNYLNQITYLGGDDRLRGYPTSFFVGKDVVAYNLELRSRPVELLSCQLAGVAFYSAGDAFNGLDKLAPVQSLGFGLRALFPQLDRTVFRVDIGFPMERPLDALGVRIPPYSVLLSFGQAFATPTVSPMPVLPTGQ